MQRPSGGQMTEHIFKSRCLDLLVKLRQDSADLQMSVKQNQLAELQRLLNERIVIIDGAMGTVIQLHWKSHDLGEAWFRGDRFKDWKGKDLKGNNELLQITQPQIIEDIHRR